MLDSYNQRDCDICGNKGPCFYCNRQAPEPKKKDYLFDYLYEPHIMIAVDMDNHGKIESKTVSKAQIIDIGTLSLEEVLNSFPEDKVFGIPDMKVEDLFPKKLKTIKKTKIMPNMLGLSVIYIGLL